MSETVSTSRSLCCGLNRNARHGHSLGTTTLHGGSSSQRSVKFAIATPAQERRSAHGGARERAR